MPRFEPFAGLRYDPEAVRLDDVIAPPYDVIGSAERTRLAMRHPANAVLVELPEPDLAGGRDRYQVAAGLLADWQARGVLRSDAGPAFYPYRMTTADGKSTLGVLGALGLPPEPPDPPDPTAEAPGPAGVGEGDVLPHEETLPKPKSDRLDLLRATRANLSPIWGLSLAGGLTGLVAPTGVPAAEAYDDDGAHHQLWVLEEPGALAAVREAVGAAPVVIADGHHRYETALAYRRELRAGGAPGPDGADLVLALVVELAEDQLTVGAIHRTLSGLPEGTDLVEAFGRCFDVARAGPADERTTAALGESGSLALVTGTDAFLLMPRAEALAEAGSDLDASLVALALSSLAPHELVHRHHWREAVAPVLAGEVQAAVLLRPVTVAQIAEWARARRRMPPKTTYFSPKPRTGMVFRTLSADG